MSQVKNLRAMFENKGDDPSPPERGRSPAGFASVTSGGSASESPRPLSTVRTSFVAIQEKDGRMGLRRHPSHESASPSRRPMSTDMETESISTTAGEEVPKASRRLFVDDPIPESPRSPKPADNKTAVSNDTAGAVNDEPSHNPDKQVDEEQPSPALTSAEATQKTSSTDSALASKTSNGEPKTKNAEGKSAATRTTTATRAGQTSAAAKTLSKSSSKTTLTAKPVTSTTKRTDTKPASRTQPTTKKEPAASTKPTTATRKPAPVKVSHDQGTGFVKPKVKSPTKPVALPSSLMAPTASSVSKGAAAKPTTSRQAGSLQPPTTARAPSRASAAGSSTTRTVRRQPSTINSSNSSRPSIGPPPKKANQDTQAPKKESHVDEGFLARMMRPTQSSSSKTAEKAPATPPRKSAPRPSTSTADASSRRGSSVKRPAKVKSPAEDVAVSSNVSEAEPSGAAASQDEVKHSPTEASASHTHNEESVLSKFSDAGAPKETTLETSVSQLKISEADNDDTATEPKKPENVSTDEPVPMEEAAPETAQVETAGEVLDVAKEAESLVQTPVEPAETPALVQPVEDVVKTEAAVEEDGRDSQAVVDEKEEAVMDTMTPPEDVIPEETAAVETAEEVVALAEAGDMVETSAVPSAAPANVDEEGTKKDEPESVELKDSQDARAAEVEDIKMN